MTHSDDRGLVLPPKLAPYQVVLVPIYHNDNEYSDIIKKMKTISKNLRALGVRVKEDFRDTHKPGWKFSEYEVKGVPVRIAMGPRDLANKTVEIVRRDTLEKENILINDIDKTVVSILDKMQQSLFLKAKSFQEKNTFIVNDFSEFQEKVNLGGFVLAHWDGTSETEDEIKKLTKATIRCVPFSSEKEAGQCVFTGKPSSQRVIFAKSY
jgi:prolyl-tRNA synthetase